MTDPLIDRDAIAVVIYGAEGDRKYDAATSFNAADAVLDYLRSVLTPEALATVEMVRHQIQPASGTDLHRRIFGEPMA